MRFPTEAEFKADPEAAQKRAQYLFDKVRNTDDWKAPIEAEVYVPFFEAVHDAVMYFTATELEIVERLPPDADGRAYYRVKAVGYRAGPAGP